MVPDFADHLKQIVTTKDITVSISAELLEQKSVLRSQGFDLKF